MIETWTLYKILSKQVKYKPTEVKAENKMQCEIQCKYFHVYKSLF